MFFVHIAVIVGGIDIMSQALMLAKKPHVIIGKIIDFSWVVTEGWPDITVYNYIWQQINTLSLLLQL